MLGDEARTGRPVTATAGDQVDQVRTLVAEDRRITYDVIQTTLGIYHHGHLGRYYMKNWVYTS